MSWLAAALEWQSRAVVARHLRVYMRNWHTAFLPPAVEPVTMLVAFGVGLGGYVATPTWQGRPIEYMTYVAPGLLSTMYVVIVSAVLAGLHAAGFLHIEIALLPVLLPIVFVAGCAFAALGLCFTAIVPTIDHMNLPVFLLVLPMGLLSSTYFPLEHPVLVALNVGNPLHHLAQAFRGILLGGPVAGHLAGVLILSALLLAILVPLDLRLLRRRVLGD